MQLHGVFSSRGLFSRRCGVGLKFCLRVRGFGLRVSLAFDCQMLEQQRWQKIALTELEAQLQIQRQLPLVVMRPIQNWTW